MTETVFCQFSHIGLDDFGKILGRRAMHTRDRQKKNPHMQHIELRILIRKDNPKTIGKFHCLGSHEFDDLLFLLLVACTGNYRNIFVVFFFSSLLVSPCLGDGFRIDFIIFIVSCSRMSFYLFHSERHCECVRCELRTMCENPVFQMWLNAIGIRILLTGTWVFQVICRIICTDVLRGFST